MPDLEGVRVRAANRVNIAAQQRSVLETTLRGFMNITYK